MIEVAKARGVLIAYLQTSHPELLQQTLSEDQAIDIAEAIDALIEARIKAVMNRGETSAEASRNG
jgi:hypothetical protein